MALKRMCERNKDTTKWLYKNIGQTDLFWDHPYVTSIKDWMGGTRKFQNYADVKSAHLKTIQNY